MSAKNAKKRLTACQPVGEKILGILNSKKGSVDVTEFAATMTFVNSVLFDYVNAKDKQRPTVGGDGVHLENLLKQYEDLLNQLLSTQRFLRFFTSNRVRKNLDHLNAQLHREAQQIYLGMVALRKAKGKTPKKPLKTELEMAKQTECVKDEDGRHLWERNFQQTLMVDWPSFITALGTVIKINEEADLQLKYILDNSNTGYVSMYRFGEFLNGFGSLKMSLEKVQDVLNKEWFHGFLSSAEAERLLERQPPGTFLIRFSKSKPGSFAIAYVDANQRNQITHTLITCCPPSGFKIEEAYNRNARGRLFVTLTEVVEFYGYILKSSFKSDLSRQSWFHGDLTSEETEDILKTEPEGAFLFRFSSRSGFLAVSYVNGGQVKHGLLECLPGGYKFDNKPPIYPTLQDVVTNLTDLLKTPITSLTFAHSDISNHINKTIKAKTSPLDASSPTSDQNYAPFTPLMNAGAPRPQAGSAGTMAMRAGSPSSPPITQATLSRPLPAMAQPAASPVPYPGAPLSPSGYPPTSSMPAGSRLSTNVGIANVSPSPPNAPQRSSPTVTPTTSGGLPSMQAGNKNSIGRSTSADAGFSGMPRSTMQPVNPDYGGMPMGARNSVQMPGSDYGGMPASGNVNISTPHSPVTNARDDYGSMPTAGNTSAFASSSPAQGPSQGVDEYGSMPARARPTPSNEYGTMATPTRTLSSDDYGSMPTPGNVAKHTASNDDYGSMPSPTSQRAAAGPENYGTMPSSVNNRGTLMQPMAAPPPGVMVPPPSNAPASPSPANYGRMPSSSPAPVPAAASPSPAAGNYGRMPTPQSAQPVAAASPPPTSPANGNYGKMPTPQAARPGSVYGGSPTPQRAAAAAPTAPTSNYGKMPVPQAAATNGTAAASYGKITTASNVSAATQNYGSMPTPQSASGAQAYGSFPPPSNNVTAAQQNYGSMPTPASASQQNYGSMPTPASASQQNYGSMPTPASRTPSAASTYGKVSASSSPRSAVQANSYGAAQGSAAYGSVSAAQQVGGAVNNNYIHMPPRASMAYTGYASPAPNAGALPVEFHTSTSSVDEYGGLPSDSDFNQHAQEQVNEYGGLPEGTNPNEYGGLPEGTNPNEYGGLPDTGEYPGFQSQYNTGTHVQVGSEYGGLPGA